MVELLKASPVSSAGPYILLACPPSGPVGPYVMVAYVHLLEIVPGSSCTLPTLLLVSVRSSKNPNFL